MSKINPNIQPQKQFPWLFILSLLLPMLMYARVLGFEFVFHDDDTMILNGASMLESFNFNNIFFTDAWLSKASIELYRPWQSFTYFIDYSLGATDPTVYHLHNLLVFIAGIALLHSFLRILKFNPVIAGMLTLFYSLNILFAHNICWIPARGDLYLTFFALLSLIFLARAQETGKWFPWAPLYALSFFLGLLAKESAISILPLSVLLVFFMGGKSGLLKSVNWLSLLLALPLLALYMWMLSQSVAKTQAINMDGLWYNLPTLAESILKFYLPAEFSVMPMFKSWKTISGMLLAAGLIYFLYRALRGDDSWRRKQLLFVGLGLFLIPLLPSLAYKPIFAGFAYDYLDHRMFFIGLGLLVLLGILLETWQVAGNKTKTTVFLLFVAVHGLSAGWNAKYYENFHAYYGNAIETNPKSGLALLNYSSLLRQKEEDPGKALSTINLAIAQYPDSVIFYMEKVQNLFLLKRCDSMDGILPLLKTDVRYAGDAWIFEGVCASQRGQKEQAYKAFVQARRANPRSAEACFNIAKYKAGLNDLKTAVSYLDTAIAINVNYAQAFFDRGNVYGNLGQFDRALADYQRYLELRPDDPIGIFYRGQAYCLTNQKQLGCADLVRADQLGVAEAKSKIAVFCNGKR